MKKNLKVIALLVVFLFISFKNINVCVNGQSSIKEIVNQYINQYSESYCIAGDSEIIYDFAGNEYILQKLIPQGYMIIESETNELLEASFSADSPYEFVEESVDKIYIGPFNYFIVDDNGIFDIINNKYINEKANLYEASIVFNENIKEYSNDKDVEISPRVDTTYSTTIDNNGYTVIENYEYFRYLTTFPWNEKGTCGYVALAMLLGYFELFYNSNTIPYETDVSNEFNSQFSGFNYLYGNNERIIVNKTANQLEFSDWCEFSGYKTGNFGGTGERLHNILIDYGENIISTPIGTPVTGVNLYDTFNLYQYEYIFDSNYAYEVDYCNTNIPNFIKNTINDGFPCIGAMSSYKYHYIGDTISDNYHVVVIYGYKDDMYLSHLGWYENTPDGTKNIWGNIVGDITNYSDLVNNDKYAEILISQVSFYSAFSLKYEGPHRHSNHMLWESNGCIGTYCPCGYYECNHANVYNYLCYDNSQHTTTCRGCAQIVYEEHDFSTNSSGSLICSECGYVSSVCNHHYIYTSGYTTSLHNVQCTLCGQQSTEVHQFVIGLKGKTCSICGFFNSNDTIIPIIPTNNRKEEECEQV